MQETLKRTQRQNRSLHLWFQEISRECNNSGIDMKVLVQNLRVDMTPEITKDIFREIGKVKFGKVSTADLTTKEVNECFEEFNKLLGMSGLHISFPSYTDLIDYEKM